MLKYLLTLASLCVCAPLLAESAKPFDAAAAFGARPLSDLSLSPDGTSIVYVVPLADHGSAVYTHSLTAGAKEQAVMVSNGKPDRITGCEWASNTRLVCRIYAITHGDVSIDQSKRMAARLKAAGDSCELVTWDDLDHELDDSAARTQMLRQSDAFLRRAFGM
jgi:acetyl esterase/lipase